MKKIFVIVMMMLSAVICNAQYATKRTNVMETTEWKQSMVQINSGKTLMWSSAAFGTLSVGITLVVKGNAENHIANGEDLYKTIEIYDGNHNLMSTKDYTYTNLASSMKTTAIICGSVCGVGVLIGIYKQVSGRKRLDRIYGIQNGIGINF